MWLRSYMVGDMNDMLRQGIKVDFSFSVLEHGFITGFWILRARVRARTVVTWNVTHHSVTQVGSLLCRGSY